MEDKRKLLLFILIPLGIVAGIVMVLLHRTPDLKGIANEFIVSLSDEDFKKAYSMTSKNFQKEIKVEDFPRLISESSLSRLKKINWIDQKKIANRAILSGQGISKLGKKDIPIQFLFEREFYSWRLYGIQGEQGEQEDE